MTHGVFCRASCFHYGCNNVRYHPLNLYVSRCIGPSLLVQADAWYVHQFYARFHLYLHISVVVLSRLRAVVFVSVCSLSESYVVWQVRYVHWGCRWCTWVCFGGVFRFWAVVHLSRNMLDIYFTIHTSCSKFVNICDQLWPAVTICSCCQQLRPAGHGMYYNIDLLWIWQYHLFTVILNSCEANRHLRFKLTWLEPLLW